MTCPLNKQKPYFIYPSNYRNSQSTTSLPICPHTEAHAIIVFKHYCTARKSLMWGPCNKFHNCCQNCTETRGSKIGKRLLICCVKISEFCSNYSSALHLLVLSLSTEFTSCRLHLCQWHTHTLLMLSVSQLMFSWSSSLLPLPVMLLLLLLCWGHFFHFFLCSQHVP
jgi:hypothetical protein